MFNIIFLLNIQPKKNGESHLRDYGIVNGHMNPISEIWGG